MTGFNDINFQSLIQRLDQISASISDIRERLSAREGKDKADEAFSLERDKRLDELHVRLRQVEDRTLGLGIKFAIVWAGLGIAGSTAVATAAAVILKLAGKP